MRKRFLFYALALGIIIAYALIIGCPLYKLTGLRCPFCGMTRAHLAFLFLGLEPALAYHKFFFLGIPSLLSLIALEFTKKQIGVQNIPNGLQLLLLKFVTPQVVLI